MEKDIKNFDQFHIAFLEVLHKINAAMPGVHYDAPTRKEVEDCYELWKKDPKDEKVLTKLLEKSNISKTDKTLLFTGVAAPPVAMIGKRAAGNFPTLSFVKLVPDVLFVPSVTLLAVVGMKVARYNKKISEATVPTPDETKNSASNSAGTTNTKPDANNANTSPRNPADRPPSPRPTPAAVAEKE